MQPSPSIRNPKAVLFDLDGTLIDHFNVIYRCYVHAQEQLKLPVTDFETVKRTVGGSVPVTMSRLMPGEYVDRAVELFREHFHNIWQEDITVLPGVFRLLEHLNAQGIKCGIFTNKHGEYSRKIAAYTGLDKHVSVVVGSLDTAWRKPEKEFSEYALEKIGARANETFMIGDSPFDDQAGKIVGMKTYLVATGSHTLEQLLAESPDGAFADFIELGEKVFNLSPDTVVTD